MLNEFTECRTYLQFLSPQEQILEINNLIDDFHKDNYSYFDVKNKYNRIQQLKKRRHNMLRKLQICNNVDNIYSHI